MVTGEDIDNAYALIIGISEYKDPGIRRLNYTHADAESIFKLLTDPKNLRLSKDKIKILLDEDATLFNIKDAISNWLYKNADKDSVVFIFFAGHGGVEEDRTKTEKDSLAKYLLPFDSVLDNFYASALSNRDFNDLLLTIRSKKLVIFMDSCYSGGVSERTRDVKITEDPYKKLGEGEGRFVIAASQPDQRSYEDSRIKHGVFTCNLLKALSGSADLDNDGYISVIDAWKYLQDAVPRDAMALAGGEQEPIFRGDMTRDFVISINRERFEKIEEEEIIQRKISRLLELRNHDNLSGKQYVRLREVLKKGFEKLSDKDKKIAKLIDDFLSEDFPITTFIEDLGIIEPELLPEKKRQEQEHLRIHRKEEDRIQRDKERKKALKKDEKRKASEKQLEKDLNYILETETQTCILKPEVCEKPLQNGKIHPTRILPKSKWACMVTWTKSKWGSMIISLFLLLIFSNSISVAYQDNYGNIMSFFIYDLIFGFLLTIYIMYKERKTKITYRLLWILFPIVLLFGRWGWRNYHYQNFDGELFLSFILFAIPAFIIDYLYIKRTYSNGAK